MTTPLYRDPSRPIPERVADLLARMSVDEKLGQLQQSHTPQASHIDDVRRGSIGSFIWADTA